MYTEYETDMTIMLDNITPTDVKVYMENGTPFLDYKGTTQSGKQTM